MNDGRSQKICRRCFLEIEKWRCRRQKAVTNQVIIDFVRNKSVSLCYIFINYLSRVEVILNGIGPVLVNFIAY